MYKLVFKFTDGTVTEEIYNGFTKALIALNAIVNASNDEGLFDFVSMERIVSK